MSKITRWSATVLSATTLAAPQAVHAETSAPPPAEAGIGQTLTPQEIHSTVRGHVRNVIRQASRDEATWELVKYFARQRSSMGNLIPALITVSRVSNTADGAVAGYLDNKISEWQRAGTMPRSTEELQARVMTDLREVAASQLSHPATESIYERFQRDKPRQAGVLQARAGGNLLRHGRRFLCNESLSDRRAIASMLGALSLPESVLQLSVARVSLDDGGTHPITGPDGQSWLLTVAKKNEAKQAEPGSYLG